MQKRPAKHMSIPGQIRFLLGPVAIAFNSTNTGSWRILRPEYNHWECFKCGTCQWYCPVDAITVNKSEERYIEFDLDYCKGCGICARVCRRQCIRMVVEEN